MSVGHPTTSKGTDPLGDYQATTVSFAKTTDPTNIIMKGTYKTYPMDDGLIVFTQTFPQALVAPNSMVDTKTSKPSCRVVAKSVQVVPTPSESGYIAYTPYRQTTDVQGYDRHDSSYCGTSPQHTWTHTGNDSPAGCQALCDKIDCACYDVLPSTANDLKARTIFPGFDRTASGQLDLDCFAYHNVFPAMKKCMLLRVEHLILENPAPVPGRVRTMARVCQVTGKRPVTGNNVSHLKHFGMLFALLAVISFASKS